MEKRQEEEEGERLHTHSASERRELGGRGEEKEQEERGKRKSESGGGRVELWRIHCIRYIWFENTSPPCQGFKWLSGSPATLHGKALILHMNINERTSCLQSFKKAKQTMLRIYPSCS